MIKRFNLVRVTDHTGVSDIGVVAEGAWFRDGSVVMQQVVDKKPNSLVFYKSISDISMIHNHVGTKNEGGTEIQWID